VAKTPTDIRSLARSHTQAAINCLVSVMKNSTNDSAKATAANSLLDRGWGKATQPISGEGGEAIRLEVIQRTVVSAAKHPHG
jgi:hypothetical protein